MVICCLFGVVYADITTAVETSRENRRMIIILYDGRDEEQEVDEHSRDCNRRIKNNAFRQLKDMATKRPQAQDQDQTEVSIVSLAKVQIYIIVHTIFYSQTVLSSST